MNRIPVKALSANRLWVGQRFPTSEYQSYRIKLLWLLPKIEIPPPPFEVQITVGLSNSGQDLDNVLKGIFDALQLKYSFDDKDIHRIVAEKQIVKKGEEFIEFSILNMA